MTAIQETKESEECLKNMIGDALVQRIKRAHAIGEQFKVYIVIPLLPEGPCNILEFANPMCMNSHKAIMHNQYISISRDDKSSTGSPRNSGHTSIFTQLESLGINAADYIHFSALRKWALRTKSNPVTEVIYRAGV